MREIKDSKFLSELLQQSKSLEGKPAGAVTAERFLVVAINQMQESSEPKNGSEFEEMRSILLTTYGDLSQLKTKLLEYIDSVRASGTLADALYMTKKYQEARAKAEKDQLNEITAPVLLQCITADPSETLKKILDGKSGQAAVPAASSGQSISKTADMITRLMKKNAAKGSDEKKETAEGSHERNPEAGKAKIASLITEVKRVRTELQKTIYGQDHAINVFTTGYFQASLLSMIDHARKRPRATFLFAGPPGVGKTFLAEQAAAALKLPFMRFDMSEYADKEANIEFCGSDKVYKNGKAGNVTSFVEENPRCVLLFDEIEKANMTVIHLFLQMLDAGRLRDNYTDKEVSFTDTIIILTTNAGKQLYTDSESGDFSGVSRKVIIKALEKDKNPETGAPYFPGALCSRFASGNVTMFNHISAHNLCMIAANEIKRNAENFTEETGIHLEIEDAVFTALLFSEGSAADARTIRGRAESFFNDEIYELLRLVASEKAETEIQQIETIRIGVELGCAKPEIRELFESTEKIKVLVLASEETVAACQEKAPSLTCIGVQNAADAIELIKEQEIDFIMLDMKFGTAAAASSALNTEDVDSPARDFFKFLCELHKELPVFLIEQQDTALIDEEKVSFMQQGVRGVLSLSTEQDAFHDQMVTIAAGLYQQASMVKLARANKLVTFETAQMVSKDGKIAEIRLFDLKLGVAVDSEDAHDVLSAVSKPDVRFDDVIGAADAKKELAYFVEYLKNPKKYMGTGVKAPKGILLYGPPGTGKTMLAKAMACESDVTFIAAEGNQFLKKYVGEGSAKVHELFKTARKYAPSVLFIDEIDAIAKERRGDDSVSGGVEETLTAFLTEMDGFVSNPSKPVFVLAATNFEVDPGSSKSLDAALMRRFDRRVYIDLPVRDDRIRFLKMKIEKNPALEISENQIENIAMRSTGMSLAALDSAVELALRSAIREGSTKVTDAILEEAFETFNSGETKKWDVSQLERVARHEAGHAFLCWQSGETPAYLTIVARGDHGGYMQHAEQEGKAIYTKDELLSRIRTSLGGRAAEIAYYGERDGISTGASGDLASATSTAQKIVCTYGMDDDFGLAVVKGSVAANGTMSVEVRATINRILNEQMAEAVRLIADNKPKINALVDALMQKNHLSSDEIETILKETV